MSLMQQSRVSRGEVLSAGGSDISDDYGELDGNGFPKLLRGDDVGNDLGNPSIFSEGQNVSPLAEAAVTQLYRRTMAHDASHFLKYPDRVGIASSAQDVAAIFADLRKDGGYVTFRSGGTSLNGQGITDGLLLDTRASFKAAVPLDEGTRIWTEPGVTIRHLNTVLSRYGRRMGPDPASEIAATVGGVIANNASGMSCGTKHNCYAMLESLEFVLPSGTIINTAIEGASASFRDREPTLHAVLIELRDRLLSRPDLREEIRRQFSMKNTMGYGLNAFLDFYDPLDIFAHLLIGSEGTLAFVSEAIFRTLPIRGHIATALWIFPDVARAAHAIPELVASGASALELMDSRSLTVAQAFDGAPDVVTAIPIVDHAALLVEYQADNEEELDRMTLRANTIATSIGVNSSFTSDPAIRSALWSVRKGLYATVAGARKPGVTALLEDIAVPVPKLAGTVSQLSTLLEQFGYTNAVIFGHAKDGNLHFMLADDFGNEGGKERLEQFTEQLVDMVLEAGGTLKAEHGTGRAMAPFVERQYGPELYEVMVEIKRATDPHGILNPGVIISDDPTAHISDFKVTPQVDPLFNRCVECGYCEPACPSKQLTLTPRTRIVAQREIALARERGDLEVAAELELAFQYAGRETCAVDGMCLPSCPVAINTGDLVRHERRVEAHAPWTTIWSLAAHGWGAVTAGARVALTTAKMLPPGLVEGTTRVLRRILGPDHMPLWTSDLPAGGKPRKRIAQQYLRSSAAQSESSDGDRRGRGAFSSPLSSRIPVALYVPSCLNAMFASAPVEESAKEPGRAAYARPNTQQDFQFLCEQAGIRILIPRGINSLCCGTPWSSKGISEGYETMQEKVMTTLRRASGNGQVPIVCDNSSCTEGFVKILKDEGLEVIDAPVFLRDWVVPRLSDRLKARVTADRWDRIVLHPTCSTTHLGSTNAVKDLAGAIGAEVVVPDSWGCCAFAGDRGMLHPELTASATKAEAAEVDALTRSDTGSELYVSSNRTCEIGMTRATDMEYVSVISAVAARVRSKV